MLAAYRSYGACGASLGLYVGNLCNLHVLWGVFGPVWGWQPTGLMGCVERASLGLYVGNLGNLHVLWCVLEPVWACMLATHRSYGFVGANLRLYVGNLHVLWGVLEPVWGCMLVTNKSYGVRWSQFAAVCWQPTGLTGVLKPVLGQVGNLQVLWGALVPVWGCMLATYMSYGVCWSQFAAVCWQPTGLMGCV